MSQRWISEAELDANPGLVRSMSVQPPRGLGRVRVMEIDGVDLQPCGGTHVANTAEIGAVVVTKIEKKSAKTRRVVLGFRAGVGSLREGISERAASPYKRTPRIRLRRSAGVALGGEAGGRHLEAADRRPQAGWRPSAARGVSPYPLRN